MHNVIVVAKIGRWGDEKYVCCIIHNMTVIGNKAQVWKGDADKTEWGYTKKDIKRKTLKGGKHRYVWKSKSERAKKQYNENPKVKAALKKQQKALIKKKKEEKKKKSTPKKKKTSLSSLWKKLF